MSTLKKYDIMEFLSIKNSDYYSDLYNAWVKFAPYLDFELIIEEWEEIFSAMTEGLYEMYRVQDEDTQGEFIVAVDTECFFGTYLVETYTVPNINEILKENNINIKYEWSNVGKMVNIA